MKLIELHILQSFPVSCLNRDDLNQPKTAVFGGAKRARVSSQSWKRAIRETAENLDPARFAGMRTKLILEPLTTALIAAGLAEKEAHTGAREIADEIAKVDAEAERRSGVLKVRTLVFISPAQVAAAATTYAGEKEPKKRVKAAIKAVSGTFSDAADIALFGRMVASDHSLTLEGAAMFSHALSTHRTDTDLDFYAAVDDLQNADEAGAGMTGTLEFNSATYYRYVGLNLDLFAKSLASLSSDQRRAIVRTFLESCLTAIPGARRNSMNASTLPAHVLGTYRAKGQPLQLVNAFEKPVTAKGAGLVAESVKELQAHREALEKTWGVKPDTTVIMPEKSLAALLDELTAHVE